MVKIVAFLMVTQLLCGFWVAGMSVTGLFPSAILREALIRIAVVEMVWHLLMAAMLIRPFLMRNATAWAAVESILLCTAASSGGEAVLAVTRPAVQLSPGVFIPLGGATTAIRIVLEILLVVFLFRARGWFGVGEREGWRTLWNGGWWALLVTGGLGVAYLLAVATRG